MTLYLGVSGEVFAYSSNKDPGSEEVSGWEEGSVADSETAEEVGSESFSAARTAAVTASAAATAS